jgi:hypothetical protein
MVALGQVTRSQKRARSCTCQESRQPSFSAVSPRRSPWPSPPQPLPIPPSQPPATSAATAPPSSRHRRSDRHNRGPHQRPCRRLHNHSPDPRRWSRRTNKHPRWQHLHQRRKPRRRLRRRHHLTPTPLCRSPRTFRRAQCRWRPTSNPPHDQLPTATSKHSPAGLPIAQLGVDRRVASHRPSVSRKYRCGRTSFTGPAECRRLSRYLCCRRPRRGARARRRTGLSRCHHHLPRQPSPLRRHQRS